MLSSFRAAVAAARRDEQLYFATLLPEETIANALGEARELWQGWIYTPAVTVWVFLAQCLSPDHSCREAVAKLVAWRVAQGRRACSAETGAYCTARQQLPEPACRELMRQTGAEPEQAAPAAWLWKGRRVRVVDGTTVTMPDTPKNQAAYPQLASQKAGCGFPIIRLVVVFSLAVGTVLEAALSKYEGKQTGENSLFRTLWNSLRPRDVVLADRYYCGWFDFALLRQQQVELVVRKHQQRSTDFRTGTRLGKDDHLIVWLKPPRPEWMSPEVYATLPEQLTLREVRVLVTQRGFRTTEVLVVTTLLDPTEFSLADLAQLYRRRWEAELNLRSLKVVLQMDQLRCKTPDRVRNELHLHLTAYNLIRKAMALAAQAAECEPWQVSFKGTLQTVLNFLPLLASSASATTWGDELLKAIATHSVGDRPDRYEPRLVKRRPKQYKHLKEPRANYKRRAK